MDRAKAEAFAGRMVGVLNNSFLALMASIGHQTGLFETMAELEPSTSEEIAKQCGLEERYVREWLGAVTTGGIVEYNGAEKTYRLPPEHAAALTSRAGSGNFATMMQFLSCMGEVETSIVECFRNGGGLPYAAYERFHEILKGVTGQTFEETLTSRTLHLAPGLIDSLRDGIDVLDVGCGSGHAINLMAREFPASRFTGYDFSSKALAAGISESREWNLENTRFKEMDVAKISDRKAFDLITAFDSIHDQAHPDVVLKGIAEALRDAGTFLMVDITASSELDGNRDHLFGPYLYGISTLHCMSVSLGLGGKGLGTMWGEEKALRMLAEAGFGNVSVQQVKGDLLNSYYVARKT